MYTIYGSEWNSSYQRLKNITRVDTACITLKSVAAQIDGEGIRLASVRSSPTYKLLLQHDSKFLFLFALFGLVAGIITYIGSLSYDESDLFSNLSYPMNLPSFLVLFGFEWFVANPNGFSILNGDIGITTVMIGSVAVWFGIGLVVYGFVKMSKLGQ